MLKEIKVNKQVEITDNYAAGESRWGREDYLNITAIEGDSKDGFVNAVFAFDATQSCCESFGVEYDDGIFGKHFVKFIKVYENEEPSDAEHEFFDEYGEMIVEVETEDKVYKWKCYNDHNGYYGHTIEISINEIGEKTFEYENVY